MARDQTFPGANITAQWYANGVYAGIPMDADGGVLHTTEGTGWPGYQNGATAPNASFLPDIFNRRLRIRQHFPVDMSARALMNQPGGVQTNTLDVVQIELIGTCDPTHVVSWNGARAGVDYIYWPDAPDWLLGLVAEQLVWLNQEHGIALASPAVGRWTPYPRSAGSAGGQRLTPAQWTALQGWVGHQHIPENDHGDPGALDFPKILALARAMQVPTPSPTNSKGPVMGFLVNYFTEVWLIGSDGMKMRISDPDIVHAYQAMGVQTSPADNVLAKKIMALNPTRPSPA